MKFSQIVSVHTIIAIKRTFFDKYGEEKLKEGFFANGSNLTIIMHRFEGRLQFRR